MKSRSRTLRLLLTLAMLTASVASSFPQPTYATPAHPGSPLRDMAAAPASQVSPFTWVFQGAAPELYAQQDLVNVTDDQESVSGSVIAIAPSPTNADLIYAAGVNGGVWKTSNATAATPAWTPLTDNLKSLSMGALALDLTDATGQTVVAGTGRYSGYASRGDDTVGLYYTTDGGASWTVTTDAQLAANSISGVAARGSMLMAASAGGLYRSTTGPLGTWTKISGTGILPNAPAMSIVADPANASRFFVTFRGATGGIFRTDDLGATWINVTAGIAGISANTTFVSVALGPGNTVFALLNGTIGGVAGDKALYRSSDSGATWTALDVPPGAYYFSAGWTNAPISADKTNPNLVYVSGYEMPIYRVDASKPAGQQPSQQYASISDVSTNAALNYGKPHPDHTALALDATGALLNGNHGGLFRLGSPGAPASATNVWASLNGNLGVSEIHDIAYDGLSNVLAGGFQDNGAAYQVSPDSTTWTRRLAAGDGGDVVVDDVSLATAGATVPQVSSPLTAAATSTTAYLRVVTTSVFPPAGTYNVQVDNEQMFVTDTATFASTIVSAAQSGATVTMTMASVHGLAVGQTVTISGVSVAGYNGAVTITAVPSSTSFTYTAAATGLAAGSGGKLTYQALAVTRGAGGTTPAAHSAGAVVTAMAPSQPLSLRYASAQFLGSLTRYSFDAANTMLAQSALSISVMDDKQFTTPLVVNAVDGKRLLVGGSLRVYESLDRGTTFVSAFPAGAATVGINTNGNQAPMVYGGYINGIANPDLFYIGSGSRIYKRTAAGGAVTPTADLPAGAGTVSDIVVNQADANQVFVADVDQVFASTNGGASWTDVTGGLFNGLSSGVIVPLVYVNGPAPYIAVGTRSGVFASLVSNLGSWVKLGAGLPDVPVYDIVYDAGDDVMAVATLGRAAWKLANASAAFTPASVAPTLTLSGPTAATEHGTSQNTYSFTVTDPGDRFTLNGGTPTITGGSLVAGSLTTTGTGGSFKVIFPDGPATATVSLQVSDASGLASNTASINVSVANAAPVSTILGAPTSGSPGTTINLTSSVTDQSPSDQAVGFVYDWLVQKKPAGATGWSNYATGSTANFSYTPDVAGTYNVFFRAKDKDGLFSGYASKTITAASPDLTEENVTLTVGEGMAAVNSGTFANVNGNPLALSASVGTLAQGPAPIHGFRGDGNADDSVTGGSAGTINGGVTFTPGQVGQAFNFPGSGGAPSDSPNVNYPASDFAPGTGDFSVAFGIKTTGSTHQAVLGNRSSPDHESFFYVTAVSGKLAVELDQDSAGTNYVLLSSNTTIADGNFHLVTITRSGTTVKLYIDGVLETTGNSAGTTNLNSSNSFRLGAAQGALAGYVPAFSGQLDEVRIYNGALSDAHIAQDYNAFVAGTSLPAVYGTWSWSYATDDGPAQGQDVTITATDLVNDEVTELSFPLTVENAAPTAALSNSGPVSEGHGATVSFADQSDPSVADTAAGFRYAYDFDNDGVYEIGDGTYAGSSRNASASVPASLLGEGPGALTVAARIIDKDGGFSDYTTSVAIDNAPPSAAASGPSAALVDQQVTFVLSAADASAADQAAGFAYTVTWGDGTSETVGPVAGTGDATARHAFQAAGPYTIQVTATDQNGAASAPASVAINVDPLTAASLQALLAGSAGVVLAPASDANLQSDVAAINGLSASASPLNITVVLKGQPYGSVTLSPPTGVTLNLAGNHTSDTAGTQLFSPTGPAVTVAGGQVYVQGETLATTADAPTVLVTGGNLTLGQTWIDESTGSNNAAIEVTGSGHVDYGFDVVTNINGDGGYFRIPGRQAITFPEGIDDFLVPNMFAENGTYVSASHRSATSLTATPAGPSSQGQAVTFTASVSVNAAVLGNATGSVEFYDGATLLATVPLQLSGGTTSASYTSSSLSPGAHMIEAYYSGDKLFIASSAALTQSVMAHINYLPIVGNDSYSTLANTPLAIAAPGVLANDSDADGNTLTAVKIGDPAHGTVTLNANGSFTYTPASGYVGGDSFTYKANDGKADSNVATVSIRVSYSFAGFFQPVDNLPVENQVKAGQGVPIKFSLGGNFGLGILAAGSPTSLRVTCPGGAPVDDIEQTTTSNSGLTYDAAASQYTYVWKTDKAWANTCRQFTLRLTDGTDHVVLFRFKK